MTLKVICQTGLKYQDTIDYALIIKKEEQFAILSNHVDCISSIEDGFIKMVAGEMVSFIYVRRAILEFKNNTLRVFSINSEIGKDMELAKAAYNSDERIRKELSKKENVDYSKLTKDLQEHIVRAKAGHI